LICKKEKEISVFGPKTEEFDIPPQQHPDAPKDDMP
jgi:hypothetical protein